MLSLPLGSWALKTALWLALDGEKLSSEQKNALKSIEGIRLNIYYIVESRGLIQAYIAKSVVQLNRHGEVQLFLLTMKIGE